MRRVPSRFIVFGLLAFALSGAAQNESINWVLRQFPDGGNVPFVALPADAEAGITALVDYVQGRTNGLDLEALSGLITFIRANYTNSTPWRPEDRWGAEAAAAMTELPVDLQTRAELVFDPRVPDHVKLPNLLRYSTIEDMEAFDRAYTACVRSMPATDGFAHGVYLCTEETTPNLQSSAYYAYTNIRTLVRVRIDGQDALFSFASMYAPSSVSRRGAPIGSHDNGVYFYSDRTGIGVTGVTWVESQMYIGNMLSAYVALDSNTTAQCIISWVNAGWRGVNVTRAAHIHTVLQRTMRDIKQQASHPDVTVERLAAIMADVDALSDEEVDREFGHYADFVRKRVKQDGGGLWSLVTSTPLQSIFSEGELTNMPMRYRRAIVAQERVRALMETPTWSVGLE